MPDSLDATLAIGGLHPLSWAAVSIPGELAMITFPNPDDSFARLHASGWSSVT